MYSICAEKDQSVSIDDCCSDHINDKDRNGTGIWCRL